MENRAGLFADKLSFSIIIFSAISILAQISLILSVTGKLPPQIPIFYSKSWGEPMLGPPLSIWILPAVAAGTTIVNFSLARFFSGENKFTVRTLSITVLVVNLMALYGTSKIISLLI